MLRSNSLITLTLFLTIAAGCSEEDTGTVLEGVWKGQCFNLAAFSDLGFTENTNGDKRSTRIEITFNNSQTSTTVREYTDNTCTLNETILPADESNFFTEGKVAVTFTIGNQITTSDGMIATEIDYVLQDGSTSIDIFLIQDGTLYFGATPPQCFNITQGIDALISCTHATRADNISFFIGYAQNGEPVIIEPIIEQTPFGPPVISRYKSAE